MNAVLALEDGTWYQGVSAGAPGHTEGEVVFNTSANTLVSAQPVNDGNWHHVAYTRNEENATLYIDGELAGIQNGFLLPGAAASTLQDEDIRILDGAVEIGRNLEIESQPERQHPRQCRRQNVVDKSRNGTLVGHSTEPGSIMRAHSTAT